VDSKSNFSKPDGGKEPIFHGIWREINSKIRQSRQSEASNPEGDGEMLMPENLEEDTKNVEHVRWSL